MRRRRSCNYEYEDYEYEEEDYEEEEYEDYEEETRACGIGGMTLGVDGNA